MDVDDFVTNGFVRVPGAFPRRLADAGRALLWDEIERDTALRRDDPATWDRPVVRLDGSGAPPFREAANTDRLREAYDLLVGPGRWVPRGGLGTWPVRFPHPDDPGDGGWHCEGSYLPEGASSYFLNLRSRGRALLMLFLFSDVGPDDAPTRIRVGSHLDVPPLLEAAGERGRSFMTLAADAVRASDGRPVVYATGEAGDVYLCHPFLVHGAQPHHGPEPRFMAQPPLDPTGLLDLDDPRSPVERAVLRGLGR